jgi:hypothetical protein
MAKTWRRAIQKYGSFGAISFEKAFSQGDIVGRVTAHYIAQLINTCFCAYTIEARSTTNRNIRREIQIPQMFEPDPAQWFD